MYVMKIFYVKIVYKQYLTSLLSGAVFLLKRPDWLFAFLNLSMIILFTHVCEKTENMHSEDVLFCSETDRGDDYGV